MDFPSCRAGRETCLPPARYAVVGLGDRLSRLGQPPSLPNVLTLASGVFVVWGVWLPPLRPPPTRLGREGRPKPVPAAGLGAASRGVPEGPHCCRHRHSQARAAARTRACAQLAGVLGGQRGGRNGGWKRQQLGHLLDVATQCPGWWPLPSAVASLRPSDDLRLSHGPGGWGSHHLLVGPRREVSLRMWSVGSAAGTPEKRQPGPCRERRGGPGSR